MTKKQKTREINRLVAYFGGTQLSAANAIGVRQSTVNAWLKGKHGISPLTAMKIEKLTSGNFRAVDLCPSLQSFAA